MRRIACLLVPELPLAALLRTHPELEGTAFAVATAPGARAEILAASPHARRQGVRPFQTAAQARAACADLVIREVSEAASRAAREALLDVALSTSPRAAPGPLHSGVYAAEATVFVDAEGCGTLFQSERGLASALAERARRLGVPAVVAIASSRAVAHLAARELGRGEPGEILVIQAGDEAEYVAPLSFDLLDLEDELADRLTRFGLRCLGDLARLPENEIATRLGSGAAAILDLAHGRKSDPRPPLAMSTQFEESTELDVAVDRLEPLIFVLRGMVSRLTSRLRCRQLACGDLALELRLEGGQREARRVGVAAATLDTRVLLRLVALSLEARPPCAPIEFVSLQTEGRAPRADQLDFFRPAGPAPRVFSQTVAELEALCGVGRVGAPALADDHRPDSYRLRKLQNDKATAATPQNDKATCTAIPVVRALRPPVRAEVYAPHGSPERLRSAVANGDVLHCAGPWRTTGAWWSEEERFAFDHFDVATSDGHVLRLRRDLIRALWEIDAVYD